MTEISRAMADYNLLVLPVVDSHDRLIGAVTVDDVIEAAIGPEQRRVHG